MSTLIAIVLPLIAAILLAPAPARAYVDPGTGSLALQGIIAAVLGLGLTLKLYWRKIRKRLTGKRPNDKPAQDDEIDAHQ
jgi:hypothetical protein